MTLHNYEGPERRRFLRQRAHFITQYRIMQPPEVVISIGKKEYEAVMLDLCEGGVAISARHEVPSGSVIYVTWTMINPCAENDDRIRDFALEGQVRDCSPMGPDEFRLGVNFVNIGDGDRRAIASFIKSNRR